MTAADASYLSFSQRVSAFARNSRTPLKGTFEVTHRCNLTCTQCYNNLAIDDPARQAELTRDEHFALLDQLRDAGTLWLLYTGGEVFARPDFIDIYRRSRERGFIVTVFTNGTLLTPRSADVLAHYRPFGIEITLYGATKETYEAITRVPGSHARCLRGIELCLERKLPLKLKTVAVAGNVHGFDAMKRFAAERGVEFKFDAMINGRIDCSTSPFATRLSPEQVVNLDVTDEKRSAAWADVDKKYNRAPVAPVSEAPADLYHCGGAVSSFSIDPFGRLSVCSLTQNDQQNLKQVPFAEGWKALGQVRAKKATRVTKCTHCTLKSMCGMCPAMAAVESGDAEEPVDFFCRIAHLRALSLGFALQAHGACEYCPGGEHHEALASAATRLRRGDAPPLEAKPKASCGCAGGCGKGAA